MKSFKCSNCGHVYFTHDAICPECGRLNELFDENGASKYSVEELLCQGESAANKGDGKAAYDIYRKAADMNSPEAMVILGDMHYSGEGALGSITRAAEWYMKAAALKPNVYVDKLTKCYECTSISDKSEIIKIFARGTENGCEDARKLMEKYKPDFFQTVIGSFPNGDIYDGQVLFGHKEGKGTYTWANGNIYEGDWKDNRMTGQGKITLANGNMYEGGWNSGKHHGYGKFTWANGNIYEGDWMTGKMHGRGRLTLASGSIYEGGWRIGRRSGWGKFTWADGTIYEGEWQDDKMTGQGKLTWTNGKAFEGSFVNGKPHGDGRMIFADGTVQDVVASVNEAKTKSETKPETKSTTKDKVKRIPSRKRRPAPNCGRTDMDVILLGSQHNGKTTLMAAITAVLNRRTGLCEAIPYEKIDNVRANKSTGIHLPVAHIKFEMNDRQYTLLDCRGDIDIYKTLLSGVEHPDAAILVVDAESLNQEDVQQIQFARRMGIEDIVVFLNRCDKFNDTDKINCVRDEIKDQLISEGYENCPIIAGSAYQALQAPDGRWGDGIMELLKQFYETVPMPMKICDEPFLMCIEDVFGPYVSGTIQRGTIHVGDDIEIVDVMGRRHDIVTSIKLSKKVVDQAQAGDLVLIVLKEADRMSLASGQVLTAPGIVTPHTEFVADIYVPSKAEGYIWDPFRNGARSDISFRKGSEGMVTGDVTLLNDLENIAPGEHGEISVKLMVLTPIEIGQHFRIRRGGNVVATGIISDIVI